MPPENAVYRIDDLDSGASIKANTNFIVPPSGIFVLRLSPDDNDLVNSNNKTENHRVSVTGLYNSTSDEVPGAYDLKIRRVFL